MQDFASINNFFLLGKWGGATS